MRLLDRYLLRHFFLAYAVCFLCLLALYIVIDAFARIDDFFESAEGTGNLGWLMGRYYALRVPWLFQRLDGVLMLLATVFTMAWLEARNELVALRAAGVSTFRILRPLLAANLLLVALGVANREFVLPPLCPYLQVQASELNLERGQRVQGCYDANLVHIEGRVGYPDLQMIQIANITLPSPILGQLVHLSCKEMFYHPSADTEQHGWVLMAVEPEPMEGSVPGLRRLGPGKYFLRTQVNYERLTRSPDWFRYLSTIDLSALLRGEAGFPHRSEALALFHRRLTQPWVELLLVVLCMRIVAGPMDQRLYLKLGCCLGLYVATQVTEHWLDHLTRQDGLEPVLAAWLPIFALGPLAFAWLVPIRWSRVDRPPSQPVELVVQARVLFQAHKRRSNRLESLPRAAPSSIAS
jgi:lipopolysaccharide export system permease protein